MTKTPALHEAQQKITALEEELNLLRQQEELRQRLLTGAATRFGQDYFNEMVLELAATLGADYTLIGEIVDGQHEQIKTLALCAGTMLQENIEYALAGSPCADVLQEEAICCHPTDVSRKFPEDRLLQELGIEAYVGIPLYDTDHRPLGIIAVLYQQPLSDPLAAETTLQLFGKLTAAQILRQREIVARNRIELAHLATSEQLLEQGAELNENQLTLNAIIETLPSPLFYKNRQGIYTGCNQAFCKYLGKRRDQIVGKSVYEIAPAHLASVYHRADLELMQQRGTQTYQARVRYADGRERDILFNKATIGSQETGVLGLVGAMTDVTELNETKQLLAEIINAMPSALITIDSLGKINHWNLQAELLSGLSADEAIGQELATALPLLSAEQALIDAALSTREVQKTTQCVPPTGDDQQFFDIMIYPLQANAITGAVIRIDNVTTTTRMQELVVQSEKMMSLGGIAAGMAHELNNPLAGIMQNTQLIRSRLLNNTVDNQEAAAALQLDLPKMHQFIEQRKVREMLDLIQSNGKRAAEIIQNMLSFSRQEQPNLQPCDLKQATEEVLELFRKDFHAVKISNELDDNLPLVLGLKSQLQQVILNLLKNSAQALADCPKRQAAPLVKLSASVTDKDVTLHVADNGPGIERELHKRIFEPFFSTKDAGKGTGLGLSVSYYIITNTHKGSLTVDSQPGRGSCFHIRLPLYPPQPMYDI